MLITVAIIGAVLSVIVIIGISRNPEAVNALAVEKQNSGTISLSEVITSKKYLLLVLMFFNSTFFPILVASIYKLTPEGRIPDHTLTLAGTLGSLFNGISRVFWG